MKTIYELQLDGKVTNLEEAIAEAKKLSTKCLKILLLTSHLCVVSRDYRLFFGQMIFVFGTMMSFVAIQWQILTSQNRGAMVGYISIAEVIPMVIFGLIGGAIADSFDKRKNSALYGNRANNYDRNNFRNCFYQTRKFG